MSKLQLEQVRKVLPFDTNNGLCIGSIKNIIGENTRLKFDFNVYLPDLKKNLQRDVVWSLLQKQELILSILKGLKLPYMAFVMNDDTDVFQVIDGKQRLTSIIEFGNNEFPLEVDGNFYYFKDLSENATGYFKRYIIEGNVAYESNDKLIPDTYKKDWFEQINFSGTPQDKEHLVYLNSK